MILLLSDMQKGAENLIVREVLHEDRRLLFHPETRKVPTLDLGACSVITQKRKMISLPGSYTMLINSH